MRPIHGQFFPARELPFRVGNPACVSLINIYIDMSLSDWQEKIGCVLTRPHLRKKDFSTDHHEKRSA